MHRRRRRCSDSRVDPGQEAHRCGCRCRSAATATPELPYFMPSEVALHNRPDDCWLSCFGRVYDLTEYLGRVGLDGPVARLLRAHAGRDVSHWFDPRGRRCGCQPRLKRYVEPGSGMSMVLLPFEFPLPEGAKSRMVPLPGRTGACLCGCCAGTFDCKSPSRDDSQNDDQDDDQDDDGGRRRKKRDLTGQCWSELERVLDAAAGEFAIGRLTKKARPCRVTNVLTGQAALISVCEEDSIRRIQERALLVNAHGASYTWRFEGKDLDASKTLTENRVPDERERYLACGLADDCTTYVPNLLLYYNDDLTEL